MHLYERPRRGCCSVLPANMLQLGSPEYISFSLHLPLLAHLLALAPFANISSVLVSHCGTCPPSKDGQ